jgi:hypothetical protein
VVVGVLVVVLSLFCLRAIPRVKAASGMTPAATMALAGIAPAAGGVSPSDQSVTRSKLLFLVL